MGQFLLAVSRHKILPLRKVENSTELLSFRGTLHIVCDPYTFWMWGFSRKPSMLFSLHHVSIPTNNMEAARSFYENVLGLKKVPRPPFSIDGEWYGIGPLQIHLTAHPKANFRTGRAVDNDDIHFALRVEDFEAAVTHLHHLGYDENHPENHPPKTDIEANGAGRISSGIPDGPRQKLD